MVLIMGVTVVQAQNSLLSQVLPLEKEQWLVKVLLDELEAKGNFIFAYSPEILPENQKVNLSATDQTVEQYLKEVFGQEDFSFIERDNKIIIAPNQSVSGGYKATINGYVRENGTGESLVAATIKIENLSDSLDSGGTGVVTNGYGFYSITLPAASYELTYSYVGFEAQRKVVHLSENTNLDVALQQQAGMMEELVIEAGGSYDKIEQNVESVYLGKSEIGIQEIKQIPALIGEVDIIKAIQLLPGVQVQGEGSTNFFVRGGAADQNLVLLDEAPVYNASHLMGFFSVFNPDAINNIQFYRGNIPAAYGGRLSSLLDIRMKEGNSERFSVSGGIGLISSRLTVEGPVKRERSSFIVSARRTYADLFLKFSKDEFTRSSSLYFYDINAKLNYKLNENNKLYVSGYFGRDLNKFRALQYVIDWGNITGSLRWNHLFSHKLFSNTSLIFSRYDYNIDLSNEASPRDWRSEVRDYALKSDFSYYPNPNNFVSFGLSSTYHRFKPGEDGSGAQPGVPPSNALEHGLYLSNEQKLGEQLTLEYGLRFSLFQLIGEAEVIQYDDNHQPEGTINFKKGEIYKNYYGLEPRFSARYLIGSHTSIKFSYNRQRQYLQSLSNLALGFNVFDIWMPSSLQTKPQTADAFSLGYFMNSVDKFYEFSVETYYKQLSNQVDYKDHAQLIMNRYLEGELLYGKGRAYGIEFMARRRLGRLTGWFSYTLSRAERSISEINGGQNYPAAHDQPHSLTLVASYQLSPRWSVSSNFVYATGRPTTLPEETYRYQGYIVPVYGKRSADRMPDYHRLDLSANLYPKEKPGRKNHSYWTFSLYNAYSRYNAATVFVTNELADIDLVKDNGKSAFHKLSIFGIVPSVTYNFKF